MDYYNGQYYGMHFYWWIFWVFIWISLFSFWTPIPRRQWRTIQAAPHNTLARRLASGEINENEYERLKAIVERDKHLGEKTVWRRGSEQPAT